MRYNLHLKFEEAAFGVQKDITINKLDECSHCHGSGAYSPSDIKTCNTCKGSGQIRMQKGFFAVSQTCSTCNGSGSTITNPCKECKGKGKKNVSKNITVKVPAGIEEGMQLRYPHEGEAGMRGGPAGDLYVAISIASHPLFSRDGADVICELPISFVQAALGTKVDVPTLDGKVSMTIPAGTQHGAIFRLKDKGMYVISSRSSKRGSQLVKIKLEVPTKLSDKQKELLKEFADASEEEMHPQGKGFFDKVRELFG